MGIFETITPFLVLVGLAATASAAAWLLADPRWRRHDDLLLFALRATARLFIAAASLALLLWTFAIAGIGLFVMVLIVGWMVFSQSRASQRRALVSMLAAASSRQMPLAPALEALADESSGALGMRLDLVASRVRRGEALPEALASVSRVSPPLLPATAAVGIQCDGFGEAMRLASEEQIADLRIMQRLVSRLWYAVFVAVTSSFLVASIGFIVIPKFQKIVYDFEINLNPMASAIWAALTSRSFLAALGYVSVPLLILAVAAGASIVWNPASPWIVRWFTWRLQFRGVLGLLSLAAARQAPLSGAMSLICDYLPSGGMRRRLQRATIEVHQGEPVEQALCRQGLLTKAQAGVLRAAERVGNLPWALREISALMGRREARRIEVLINTLTAALITLASSIVLLAAIGIFLPVIQLMLELS